MYQVDANEVMTRQWGFPSPDDVGQSEYRAIFELLEDGLNSAQPDGETTSDELADAMLEEVIGCAKDMRARIQFKKNGPPQFSSAQGDWEEAAHAVMHNSTEPVPAALLNIMPDIENGSNMAPIETFSFDDWRIIARAVRNLQRSVKENYPTDRRYRAQLADMVDELRGSGL